MDGKRRAKFNSSARVALATAAFFPGIALAEALPSPASPQTNLPENDKFAAAAFAAAQGHPAEAIAIYAALERDPSLDVRCEARFRHAQLLIAKSNYSRATILLRATLDEKPDWQLARLTLAHTLARIGREPSARRELRQAQVVPAPIELKPLFDSFADDLLKIRPLGGDLEVAFAPNSSIDRATAATLINPEVLPFTLTRSPVVPSGVGIRLSSMVFGYLPVTSRILATARLSLNDHLYRVGSYDDHIGTAEIGGIAQWHRQRLRATVGETLRVYGAQLNSKTSFIGLNWLHAIGGRGQIEIGVNLGDIHYENNKSRDGKIYAFSLAYETAFSARSGGRFAAVVQRETARTKGFASELAGINGLVWHEVGKSTISASFAVQRLAADGPIALSAQTRKDWLVRGGGGISIRKFKILGFAPALRATYTRNLSSVTNQGYSRLEGEFALNKPF